MMQILFSSSIAIVAGSDTRILHPTRAAVVARSFRGEMGQSIDCNNDKPYDFSYIPVPR